MYILTYRGLSNSARAIGQMLTEKFNTPVKVRFGDERPLGPPIIRWGNPAFEFNGDTPFNSPNHIRTAANKRAFSNTLHAANIPVIRFNTGVPEKWPVVVRKTLSGKGGEGIVVCQNYEEWRPYQAFAWSYWHNFKFELGVHIFNDKIIKIFKKVKQDNLPEDGFPIRNLSRGYRYVRVDPNTYPKLIPFVQEFHKAFPIGFGRADIGWDEDGKLYRHIEFNSAPGVSTNADTLQCYVDNFVEHLAELRRKYAGR